MKKFIATFVMMGMMAMTFLLPVSAAAQTRRNYNARPNIYQRHRNVINVAAGTGAGALLGALLGGKKGAGIGALIGAGGSALYSYKIKPKQRRY